MNPDAAEHAVALIDLPSRVIDCSMDDVKRHAYFKGISWDDLRGKRLPTPWVPEELVPPPTRTAADVERYNHSYKGDQV